MDCGSPKPFSFDNTSNDAVLRTPTLKDLLSQEAYCPLQEQPEPPKRLPISSRRKKKNIVQEEIAQKENVHPNKKTSVFDFKEEENKAIASTLADSTFVIHGKNQVIESTKYLRFFCAVQESAETYHRRKWG
jgi:hypothetical protein